MDFFRVTRSTMSIYTEGQLVEQPAIQVMQHELGWEW